MGRILVVGGNVQSLVYFRGDMIKSMIDKGHSVFAMAPETDLEGDMATDATRNVSSILGSIGVPFLPIPLNRTGTNPLLDLRTVYYLTQKMKELQPDVVLSYTMKPVIYASIAARIAGVENIFSMITGLGYVFTGDSLRQKVLSKIVVVLYKISLSFNKKIYFMNPDDLYLFKKLKLWTDIDKTVLINGSGVNIDHYYYTSPKTDNIVFLIIARLLWNKGVGEYVSAARLLKTKYPEACFRIVGPFDNNPSAITRKDIQKWQEEGLIEYMGATEDVRPYIADCSVYVLPSYREGTPRSVLEAMSMGRPIITTDAPGCRETVIDGVNGFLVPVRDSVILSQTMEKFIQNKGLIADMGAKSRKIVETRYDVNKVNQAILQAMGLDALVASQNQPSWDLASKSPYV